MLVINQVTDLWILAQDRQRQNVPHSHREQIVLEESSIWNTAIAGEQS